MKKGWLILFLCLVAGCNTYAAGLGTHSQIIKQSTTFYVNNCMQSGPVIDSTIAQGKPNPVDHEEFYLKFDLKALPENSIVKSAVIELFCEERFVTDPEKCKLTYERIIEYREKPEITSENKARTSGFDIITGSWPCPGKIYTVDITPFVQGWQTGRFPNYGIYAGCRNSSPQTGYAVFTSSNIYRGIPSLKGKLEHVPKLIIKYTEK